MDLYSFLRQLADSWVLLALFLFFVGAVVFAFRPGSRGLHADAADVPFRHEDGPARDTADDTGGPANAHRRVAAQDRTEALK